MLAKDIRQWGRWAAMTGGALLAVNYLFWIGNGISPDRVPAGPESPSLRLAVAAVALATVLLAIGLAMLLRYAPARLGRAGEFGGWLLVVGFLFWALGAVASFLPVVLPRSLVLATPFLTAIGSGFFGLAGARAAVLPGWVAVAVGGLGPLGLAVFAVPELVWGLAGLDVTPAVQVRVMAYAALLVFGAGWVGVGHAASSCRAARDGTSISTG